MSHAGGSGYLQIYNTAVNVVKGNITEQQVDCIVNSTNPDLGFENAGLSSKAILAAAGLDIQSECKKKSPIQFGQVAITGPGDLNCSNIFHITLPSWKNKGDEDNIKTIVRACMVHANQLGLKSIAFPAIGTGPVLKYWSHIVARKFFEGVAEYNTQNPGTNIDLILIVAYNEDVYQKAVMEARKRARQNGNESRNMMTKHLGSSKFRNTTVNLMIGDLTGQQADVLVHTCSGNLTLGSTPGLPKSILHKGGQEIQDALNRNYSNGIKAGEFAVTNGYGLQCQKVYHGNIQPFSANGTKDTPGEILGQFIKKCLSTANQYGMRNIVFPSLGTGNLKFPPDISASIMVDKIKEFVLSNQQTSVQEIRIILFGGNTLWSTIEKAYKQELGITPTISLFPKGNAGRKIVGVVEPKMGTKDYFRYKYSEDPRPPTNWCRFTCHKTIKEWVVDKGRPSHKNVKEWVVGKESHKMNLIKPDKRTYQAVEKLFTKTIGNANYKVISIMRNENLTLYEKYFQQRQRLYSMAMINGPCKPLNKTKWSSGSVLTSKHAERHIGKLLDNEINEVYLFHGTKRDRVNTLLENGFNTNLSGLNFPTLRLGAGIYTAENASLSAGYTEKSGECNLLVMRACLGDVYTTKANMNGLKKPPCKKMCSGICTKHPDSFDSVVGEFKPREFVLYEDAKCYPEYLIKYKV